MTLLSILTAAIIGALVGRAVWVRVLAGWWR